MAKDKDSGKEKGAAAKGGAKAGAKEAAPKEAVKEAGGKAKGGVSAKIAAESAGTKSGGKGAAKGEKAEAGGTSTEAPAKEKGAKSISKGQFFTEIAAKAGLEKGQVSKVFDAMSEVIVTHLGQSGAGVVALPGLLKLSAKRVEAVKGGQEVPNRFKPGQMTVTKDKPAETKVKVRPLKGLKEKLK